MLVIVALSGAIEGVHAGYLRIAAVLVIVMLLTSALPPILRRLPPREKLPTGELPTRPAVVPIAGDDERATELLDIADRLEELVPEAGALAWRIEREVAQLRRLASRVPSR